MKRHFNKLLTIALSAGLSIATLLGFSGVASAACWQYNPNGFVTSKTPVFNNICNVPGYGNESDFVRIRPDTTGNDTSTSNNAAYTNALSSVCNDGDSYDVHTYIHNDAMSASNDNGNGSAIAHDVKLALSAPLGSKNNNFTFGSTVSASNAATVHDTATLSCSGGPVKLTLVPGTVKIYGTQYPWTALPDSSVNSTFKIGSPTIGSGNMWGCWEYRIAVVYQVKVQKIVKPQVTATCDMFSVLANADRTVTVNQFKYTATNATFKSVAVDWGDHATDTINSANQVVGTSHQYAQYGTYDIVATVHFTTATNPDLTATSRSCEQQVTFTPTTPPKVTPPPSVPPTTPPAPTQLVNTGPGSIIGLFSAATILGMAGYRRLLGRRLNRQ